MEKGSNRLGERNPNFRTGMKVKGSKYERLYHSWQGIKSRCLSKSHPKYHRYGGRGIKVSQDWMSATGFLKWAISSGWVDGMTIDRIDNDGDYTPENCRWISRSANSRKKSTTKITFEQAKQIRIRAGNGEDQRDLAREFNVVHGTVWFIVNKFTHVGDGECTKKLKSKIKRDI